MSYLDLLQDRLRARLQSMIGNHAVNEELFRKIKDISVEEIARITAEAGIDGVRLENIELRAYPHPDLPDRVQLQLVSPEGDPTMGMITTAICENNLEWQFKHGNDQCETYRLAQPPKHGGYPPVPDGVYEGIRRDGDTTHWAILVMKRDRLVEVCPLPPDGGDVDALYDLILAKCSAHRLPKPSRDILSDFDCVVFRDWET